MQMPQPHSLPASGRPMHHLAPRQWPVLRTDPIEIPYPTPPSQPPATALLVTVASIVGLALSYFVLQRSGQNGAGGLGIGLLAVSGATALASLGAFAIQYLSARRDSAALLRLYEAELDRIEGVTPHGHPGAATTGTHGLRQFIADEVEVRHLNDPPLTMASPDQPGLVPLVERVRASSSALWQRRPGDPDFLRVRIGVGSTRPGFVVKLPDTAGALALPAKEAVWRRAYQRARDLVERCARIDSVPITLALGEHSAVAIVSGPMLTGVERALIGQIALHHSPRVVQIVVIDAGYQSATWDWVNGLSAGVGAFPSVIAGNTPATEAALARLQSELVRREQEVADGGHGRERPLPHLVLVVNALPDVTVRGVRTVPAAAPTPILSHPAIELALRCGRDVGATVVSIHATLDDAPAAVKLAVDCPTRQVIELRPNPPAPIQCAYLDALPLAECHLVSHAASRFVPAAGSEQRLPNEVNLYRMFDPAVEPPAEYDIEAMWERSRREVAAAQAARRRTFAIPIGRTTGGQPVDLDFVADGPHGLLIGQTGSGKSELLRSIVAALAITYPPDLVNFVLVDYKGGLGLDVFDQLPHTLALLTNMAQAGQTTRFLTMLEAEMRDRQEKRKRNKPFPRLFVVIDEFAEMLARRGSGINDNSDAILESLLRILRLGRALDVHLLFASQRPEGGVMQKLGGYVQYRLCLRTNTEQDSKEVLNRPDAARLPVQYPGRGYLLRGDYDLQLFQAALASLQYEQPRPSGEEQAPTADEVIARRMRPLAGRYTTARWPRPLPIVDGDVSPTPVLRVIAGSAKAVDVAWNAGPQRTLKAMEVPIGLYDRPKEKVRDWFVADLHGRDGPLSGGPLLIMGDLYAGKTTGLQTMLMHFAQDYTAEDLRWYVLDPSDSLRAFASLPHADDYLQRGQINVVNGLDEAAFKSLAARLEQAMARPAGATAAGGRPRLLLVIDDLDELMGRYGGAAKAALNSMIEQVMRRGREQQVYLAISLSRPQFDLQQIINGVATKVVLYMSNRERLEQILGRRPQFFPDPMPGRGFVLTRTSFDEIQVAAPVYGANGGEILLNIEAELHAGVAARSPAPAPGRLSAR